MLRGMVVDPRKEQARWRRSWILFTVYHVLFIGGLIVPKVVQGRAGWLDYSLIALAVVVVASYPFMRYRFRRRARVLAACDWRQCRWCRFDLRGLADTGRCPECGEEYDIEEVRKWWKDMMAPVVGPVAEVDEAKPKQ